MRSARTTTLTLLGSGALALTMMVSPAGAAPGGGQGGGQEQAVAKHAAAQTKAEQASVRAYWTADRMKNATPRELKGPGPNKGRPGGGTSSAKAVRATPQPELGKVFFTVGGTDYVCSGTATTSANRDVVTTAGHCLNEGPGSYATNFAFVPAYDNGARPHGTWVAESL